MAGWKVAFRCSIFMMALGSLAWEARPGLSAGLAGSLQGRGSRRGGLRVPATHLLSRVALSKLLTALGLGSLG